MKFATMVFNYCYQNFGKIIVISSLVAATISSEFHKGDTSSSAVAMSSGLSVLLNFD